MTDRNFGWLHSLPASRAFIEGGGRKITSLTDTWFTCRRGRITASTRADILVRHNIREWKALAEELRAEMEPDYRRKEVDNVAMKWGRDHEMAALLETKAVLTGSPEGLNEPGFLLHPDYDQCGATPDALIDDYTVQVKCPFSQKNHIETVQTSTIRQVYYHQVQFESWVSGKPRIIFASFDPRHSYGRPERLKIIEIPRDAEVIDKFGIYIQEFWGYFDTGHWPVDGVLRKADGSIPVNNLF